MLKKKIAVIGLGYVGLPLAMSFVKKNFSVHGFDSDKKKVKELISGYDRTNEASIYGIKNIKKIKYTSRANDIKQCNVFIIAVPTPVNKKNNPNLKNLLDATNLVAKCIKPRDLIIYESTVFPGTTRDICGRIIEKKSKLKLANSNIFDENSKDNFFYLGYSPERINPGDTKHTLKNVTKLISGSSNLALKEINNLYKKICNKIYICKSIEIAESAKIIENTQRDINIALINELQIVFDNLNLNIYDVLDAAKTKWNFLNFKPGLVGGHCIGVDPYYLTYKSIISGYKPRLILSGRNINENMPKYFFHKINQAIKKKFNKNVNILFLGISFKENCNDIRNSKSLELCNLLKKTHKINIFDPLIRKATLRINDKNTEILEKITKKYEVIIVSVAHSDFKKMGYKKIKSYLVKNGLFFDLKNTFGKSVPI